MYYVAICDDDLNYATYIEGLFYKHIGITSDEIVFYKYSSGEELIKDFEKQILFHLLFLDMKMEGMNGDDTAIEFRKKYPYTIIVFCSGVCFPTVKSFEVNAYRYLLKKYHTDKMINELNVIVDELHRRGEANMVSLTYRNETSFILQDDILYITKRKHGSSVFLYDRGIKQSKEQVCNKTVSQLYDEIEPFLFAYAHNSYFVNMQHVIGFKINEVKLVDGTVLNISRSKEREFKNKMAIYLSNRY